MKRLLVAFSILFGASTTLAEYGMIPHSQIKYGEGYALKGESTVQVTNMPKVRSQDSFGICYAAVAALLVDEANCVQSGNASCATAPDSQRVSALDVTRYSRAPEEGADGEMWRDYKGLNEGGMPVFTLLNINKAKDAVSEQCAPTDQIVARAGSEQAAQDLEIAMWKSLKDSYESFRKKNAECTECGLEYATAKANDIKQNYNLKASNKEILDAFSQESYSLFLDKLLIPKECRKMSDMISLEGKWAVKSFPMEGEKGDYKSSINKVKEVLTQKRPLALSFCAQDPLSVKSNKACGEIKDASGNVSGAGHAVVIKGYREICNSKGVCRQELQVQNSWGEGWQKSNDDGWVDAKELLDRTFYETYALNWLQPRS